MSPRAASWLFDLGNSRLKGAWLDGQALSNRVSLAWDLSGFDAALRTQLRQWPDPDRILIASVVTASRADRLRTALQAWPQARPQWLRSPRRGCGITNRYRVPERLGVDRFLAMAAARDIAQGASVVVIGCGTALTLDAVDADGVQQEGMIAPSPKLMLRALHGATAPIPTHLPPAARTTPRAHCGKVARARQRRWCSGITRATAIRTIRRCICTGVARPRCANHWKAKPRHTRG